MRVVIPDRPVLAPLLWLLRAGWLSTQVEVIPTGSDNDTLERLGRDDAVVALVDPAVWASHRTALQPVLRLAVSLGPGGTDLVLLSRVRLDALEDLSYPAALAGTCDSVVVRALAQEYYGIAGAVAVREGAPEPGRPGKVEFITEAEPAPFTESVSRAWWLLTGVSWVRALPVHAAGARDTAQWERLFAELGRVLHEQAESVARGVARERGGTEESWLALTQALGLSYGAAERQALSTLLGRAARMRLCPRLEDVQLPRY